MPNYWQKEYDKLIDFIKKHAEVRLQKDGICLPGSVRPQFYQLFDNVRTALIEERMPDLLDLAFVLSQNYLEVEQKIVKLLSLSDISMNPSLSRFLHDPLDQIRREVFDPLFDLLRGLIDITGFETKSTKSIRAAFWPLYRLGYEKWVILCLSGFLEPTKSFGFTMQDFALADAHKSGGIIKGESPKPEESKRILFNYDMESSFIIPDLLFYSAKINKYVAIRSQIGEGIGTATNTYKSRNWYSLNSLATIRPNLTLVYIANNPEEISLVADAKVICRPDLLILCEAQSEMRHDQIFEIQLQYENLKPALGAYIITKGLLSKQDGIGDGICFIDTGFEPSRLQPIISSLAKI